MVPARVASRQWLGPVAVGAAALGGLAFAGAVAPHGQAYYPQCPLYALTGVYCPGCGATRAVHALATGHLATAAHDNVLLLVAVPLIAYAWWRWMARSVGREGPPKLVLPRWAPVAVVLVM